MRTRMALFLGLFIFATPLFAIDRWILISGTVGTFHTDGRVFNPDFNKDISITATFFPTDGSASLSNTFTVTKRSMRVLNDVTSALFQTSKLGAIKFTSSASFEVTSRIYAITPLGTLGQFGPGTDPTQAKLKGALLQLQASNSFRTNIGIVNPNNATANVTLVLYDKNSAIVSSKTTAFAPFAVTNPTSIAVNSLVDPKSADLSDAWISFTSDQPILAYASVVDNGTTDQTFVPAVDDVGVPPATGPTTKEFTVNMQDFSISITPDPATLKVGDHAIFHIHLVNGSHVFNMVGPTGSTVVPNTAAGDRNFDVTSPGIYTYFCNNSLCGSGHSAMTGDFSVGISNDGPGHGY